MQTPCPDDRGPIDTDVGSSNDAFAAMSVATRKSPLVAI
jgi:hypothetical protein